MIIGITGLYASGKDTAAQIFEEKGFIHISLSDLIREELKNNNIEITRDNLIDKGNELREKYGNSILAQKAIQKIENLRENNENSKFVITSFRNPSEVEEFKKRSGFVLINITARIETRLRRLQERNTENDPITLEELHAKEAQENTGNEHAQQLHKVAQMADYEINNDGTVEEFKQKIHQSLDIKLHSL